MVQPESSVYQKGTQSAVYRAVSLPCYIGVVLCCIAYNSMPAVTRYSTCVSN